MRLVIRLAVGLLIVGALLGLALHSATVAFAVSGAGGLVLLIAAELG